MHDYYGDEYYTRQHREDLLREAENQKQMRQIEKMIKKDRRSVANGYIVNIKIDSLAGERRISLEVN